MISMLKKIIYEILFEEKFNKYRNFIKKLDEKTKFHMELTVNTGKGYVPADRNKASNSPLGLIAIDAVFSPVKRVSYNVSNAREGLTLDYDKLTMEVETNGSVTAEDSVAFAARILQDAMEWNEHANCHPGDVNDMEDFIVSDDEDFNSEEVAQNIAPELRRLSHFGREFEDEDAGSTCGADSEDTLEEQEDRSDEESETEHDRGFLDNSKIDPDWTV